MKTGPECLRGDTETITTSIAKEIKLWQRYPSLRKPKRE